VPLNKKLSYRTLALGLLLAAAFAACYWPTFLWLHEKYQFSDSYYSHGYLVPFIFLYLLYDRRNELRRETLEGTGSIWGLIILAGSLLVHFLGLFAKIHFISGYSMLFYLIGCTLFLFGTRVVMMLAFPFFFMVFMLPVPDEYLNYIALPLKSSATAVALFIMDTLKIPYLRDGFSIHLSNATYIVGTPCNGMRSFISFFAIGSLFLYFIRTSFLRGLVLLLMIPVLAILLNGIRIFILLYIALNYGQEAASPEFFLHDLSGMAVFIIGLAVMMLFMKVSHGKKNG